MRRRRVRELLAAEVSGGLVAWMEAAAGGGWSMPGVLKRQAPGEELSGWPGLLGGPSVAGAPSG